MKDIIAMAREAGFHCYNGCVDGIDADLERLVQAAYAAGAAAERDKWMERTAILIRGEREACAKLADDIDPVWESVSVAIRARGETK